MELTPPNDFSGSISSFSLLLAELMIGTAKIEMALNLVKCFSLLLAELMIGTFGRALYTQGRELFQSPISGVNDWNFMCRITSD